MTEAVPKYEPDAYEPLTMKVTKRLRLMGHRGYSSGYTADELHDRIWEAARSHAEHLGFVLPEPLVEAADNNRVPLDQTIRSVITQVWLQAKGLAAPFPSVRTCSRGSSDPRNR